MRFYSRPIAEHLDVPLADDGQWESIVSHWSEREREINENNNAPNASYVVSVALAGKASAPARLAELVSLVASQGDRIVGSEVHPIKNFNPRMLFGSGQAAELGQRARDVDATMLVIDAELSPSQTRNLEDATGFAVCDREAVILNVFHRNAKTKRARIQVEIAHLEYLRPRIRGIGLEMDQQAGGVIGARGSGETASELLARKLDGRLAVLRAAGHKLAERSRVQRKGRAACKRIALVGYTNAGKTSLMNALTGAGLVAADRPFETLDATSRSLTRHGGDVLISDTVGFIRDLPERLFASFGSTLAELTESSLLAIIVDASDPELELHLKTTGEILGRLGADRVPRVVVFNKIDRPACREVASAERERLAGGFPFVEVSAHVASEVSALRQRLLELARKDHERATVFVPYSATAAIELAYGRCRVTSVESNDNGLVFELEAEPHVVRQIRAAATRPSDE